MTAIIPLFKLLLLAVGLFFAIRQWKAGNHFRAVITGALTFLVAFIVNLVI